MVLVNLIQVEGPAGGRAASPARSGLEPGDLGAGGWSVSSCEACKAGLNVCDGRCPASSKVTVETSRGVCGNPIKEIKLFNRPPLSMEKLLPKQVRRQNSRMSKLRCTNPTVPNFSNTINKHHFCPLQK